MRRCSFASEKADTVRRHIARDHAGSVAEVLSGVKLRRVGRQFEVVPAGATAPMAQLSLAQRATRLALDCYDAFGLRLPAAPLAVHNGSHGDIGNYSHDLGWPAATLQALTRQRQLLQQLVPGAHDLSRSRDAVGRLFVLLRDELLPAVCGEAEIAPAALRIIVANGGGAHQSMSAVSCHRGGGLRPTIGTANEYVFDVHCSRVSHSMQCCILCGADHQRARFGAVVLWKRPSRYRRCIAQFVCFVLALAQRSSDAVLAALFGESVLNRSRALAEPVLALLQNGALAELSTVAVPAREMVWRLLSDDGAAAEGGQQLVNRLLFDCFLQCVAIVRPAYLQAMASAESLRKCTGAALYLVKMHALAYAVPCIAGAAPPFAVGEVPVHFLPQQMLELKPVAARNVVAIARNQAPFAQYLISSSSFLREYERRRVRAARMGPDGESVWIDNVLVPFRALQQTAPMLLAELERALDDALLGVLHVGEVVRSLRWEPAAHLGAAPLVRRVGDSVPDERVIYARLVERAMERFAGRDAAAGNDADMDVLGLVLRRWCRHYGDTVAVLLGAAVAYLGGGMARASEAAAALLRSTGFASSSFVAAATGELQYNLAGNKSERAERRGGVTRLMPPPLSRLLAVYVFYLRRLHEYATIVLILCRVKEM